MEKSELEQRAKARRDAALKSDTELDLEERAKARRAYMQGGPGPNDPKNVGYPGEMKYPRMEVPVGGDSRQWEQNWFEGAAATSKAKHGPAGVELELKKKLQRAKLSAKFFRQANQKDSYWEFYATEAATGKKARLFKASVDEIFGREGQALDKRLWSWVSSKDYAKFAMDKMRTDGVEKVSYAMRGIGLTREGTIRIIREQAFDKARKTVLLGRRIARNLNLAEGQLKTALASDYTDLQSVLEDLRLVEKTSSELLNTKASNENRFIIYRLADESLIDADLALQDVVDNVKTAEATVADKYGMHKKAADEEMPAPGGAPGGMGAAPAAPAGGSTPAYQDVNYGQGGLGSSVENPDRAKQKSAPMPGGGIPYEEGGQLYPTPDERQTAPMTDQLGAAHGDLPYQEWEQLTLKNLRMGPNGKLRSFDKATWVNEPLVTGTPGGVPNGNVYESHEAGPGGGLSHVDELQEAPPGLNPDLPDGRWGFESAGEDYMHLPFGGLDGGAAPMAEGAPTEEAPEEGEAPEEEKDEAAPEKEEEESADDSDDAVSEEEEEEVEASATSHNDRRGRSAARAKIMSKALNAEAGAKEDYQKYETEYMSKAHGDAAEQKYYTQDLPGTGGAGTGSKADVDPSTLASASKSRADAYNELMGGAAPAAPAAPGAEDAGEEADAEVKASFAAKKTEAARTEAALKQKRAYDLALDFQAKGWIEKSKEALHKQASIFSSLDEKAFGNFKAMCDNVKAIAQQSNVDPEKKIEQIAGVQRKVIKSGSAATSEADLLKMLSELPWK